MTGEPSRAGGAAELKKKRNKKNLLTAPLARLFPFTVLGLSLVLPSVCRHHITGSRCSFFIFLTDSSVRCRRMESLASGFSLRTHSLTECSLLCWTKWQRKKSADLTTVLRSRIPSFGWESAYLQSHLVLERWLVTSRFFAQISFKVFKLKRMFT